MQIRKTTNLYKISIFMYQNSKYMLIINLPKYLQFTCLYKDLHYHCCYLHNEEELLSLTSGQKSFFKCTNHLIIKTI